MDAKAERIGPKNARTLQSGENTFRKCTHCKGEEVYVPIRHIVQGEGKPRLKNQANTISVSIRTVRAVKTQEGTSTNMVRGRDNKTKG